MSSNPGLGETAVSTENDLPQKLSRQLHQTTQPLSVLQGLLELALVEVRTAEQYQHSIQRALEEVRRTADCFQQLRTLIAAYQPATTGSSTTDKGREPKRKAAAHV